MSPCRRVKQSASVRMYSATKTPRVEASLTNQALWMLFARVTGAVVSIALPLFWFVFSTLRRSVFTARFSS